MLELKGVSGTLSVILGRVEADVVYIQSQQASSMTFPTMGIDERLCVCLMRVGDRLVSSCSNARVVQQDYFFELQNVYA